MSNDAGRGREMIVARVGCKDQAVDTLGVDTMTIEEVLCRADGQIGSSFILVSKDPTLFDPHTGHDPFVVGVDHARKFFVVEDVFGYESAHAGDNGIDFFHERRKRIGGDVRALSVCQERANETGRLREQAA